MFRAILFGLQRGGGEGEKPFTFDKLYLRIFRTRLEQTMARVELWRVD